MIRGRYYRFSEYLKNRFNKRVFKISVNAGFGCPNIDGTRGSGGCIYCNNEGFSRNAGKIDKELREQISEGISFARNRFRAEKFILYFQAFTNTYGTPDILKKRYDVIREFDDIVSLSIGTRPDCIDSKKVSLLRDYANDYEVWLEIGLQSANDGTLALINRHHDYGEFLRAYDLTVKAGGIRTCVHVIIGLPGESVKDIMRTAGELGRLRPDAVKIHPLHVIRGTELEKMYMAKQYLPMQLEEYASLAAEFLGHLHPETVIQRMTADCFGGYLIAPDWITDKNLVLRSIEERMVSQGIYQGDLLGKT
ncbi:MAG: TIGR01212 family radical SAM protein [Elusimicrobia bacterium]|nr:TIGR01212 family radical SAM protein [Elusimicrobiota bacterium]